MQPIRPPRPSRRRNRWRIALLSLLIVAPLAVVNAASATPTLTTATISTTIGTTNVTPMWGPQLPKVVYDGSWYYAITLDGSGSQYPWSAKLWKSQDASTWTLAVTLGSWVYQPPGMVLDSGNRLWLYVPCYTGGSCFPGVTTLAGSAEQYVYLQRMQFSTKLGDGSFDFSSFNDQSVRTTTAERYYGGLAIDPNRRYIYHVYSKAGWGMFLSTFDTFNNTEATQQIATPGSSPQEGYLYARVRPGTSAGEIWLEFSQIYTGLTSTSIFGVQLWHSTNGGSTWSGFQVASCPSPDDNNFCDTSDLVIDSNDVPHVLFYKKISGVNHLYYWKGSAGSVTLTGSPIDLGQYDNHSQLAGVGTGEKFVFAHIQPTANNNLIVLRSTNGTTWTNQSYAVSGAGAIYSPNLMRPESGTFHSQGTNVFNMLISSSAVGTTTPDTNLQFLTFAG